MLNLCFQILLRCRKHQLNTVQLIYLTCTWIIVDSRNIRLWILTADLLDNTLTHNVVWQAGKWLDTNDIRHSIVDQLHHFTGEEPAFTGLVTF